MSAGRHPNKITAPKINAPTPVTQYNFSSPTGDTYSTKREGNTQYSQNSLSPQTQSTIYASQNGLQGLAQDLAQPDAQIAQNIAQQSQNFYDLQAQNINNESNSLLSQTASDLSHRFGGAYNATFGALSLGQLQKNRLNQLYNAGKEATLLGQDLYNQNQQNKINRFQVFNNYLNNQYNQANGSNSLGSNLLENEASRAQNLGIDQAKLQEQAALSNQNIANQAAQRKLAVIKGLIVATGYAASPFTGGASAAAGSAIANAIH
jgi:hypothetical protein